MLWCQLRSDGCNWNCVRLLSASYFWCLVFLANGIGRPAALSLNLRLGYGSFWWKGPLLIWSQCNCDLDNRSTEDCSGLPAPTLQPNIHWFWSTSGPPWVALSPPACSHRSGCLGSLGTKRVAFSGQKNTKPLWLLLPHTGCWDL